MEANKILNADILDIIFDGRNKIYGAYDLRKTYNKRIITAFITTAILCGFVFAAYSFSKKYEKNTNIAQMNVQDVQLDKVNVEEKKTELSPPPPPKQPDPPKVEMAKLTPPAIVPDNEAKENEKPPTVDDLEGKKIGKMNVEGVKDEGIVAPPISDGGKGIIEAPKKVEKEVDVPWTKVEIESKYPGGQSAWERFLNKNFSYPQAAQEAEIQGVVIVQFIVDKEGNVSDVEAISGPKELQNEAVRVIKKSGKWEPAIQNGQKVKSYKKQPINFRFESE